MKRNQMMTWIQRALCILLTLLLTCSISPTTASAAQIGSWSQAQILDYFSDNGTIRYDDTGFLMTPDELAVLVAETLRENGYVYQVVYDDEDSTATKKEYTLMWSEGWDNDGTFLPYYLFMTADAKTGRVLSLQMAIKNASWPKEYLPDAMDSFALIYERIHGNMTKSMRANFVNPRNLSESTTGYRAEGEMDGLYYKLTFLSDRTVMDVMPSTYANIPPIAQYYSDPYTLYEADGFRIQTGKVTQDRHGTITLDVDLINESKNPLRFQMNHAQISGYDVSLSIYDEVSPGNTKTAQLYIDELLLAALGEEILDAIRLVFTVTDLKTGEVLYDYGNYVPLGIDIYGQIQKYQANLFQNDDVTLSVIGSARNDSGSTPQIFLILENGLYPNDIILESEGNCIIGKQEYDLFVHGRASGFGSGLIVLQPVVYDLDQTATLEFDLQISSHNYNPMVAGKVTIKMDQEGNILKVTSKMRETAQYEHICEKEY